MRITGSLIVSNSFKVGDILGGNYSYFESDGTYVMTGSSTTWKDIILQGTNLRGGSSPPSFLLFTGSIYATAFVNSNDDEVHGAFEMPHDYKEGTNLEVHIHWSPSSTNTGHCSWSVDYTIANMKSLFSAPESMHSNATSTGSGIVNDHIYTTIGLITGTELKIGAIINCRLYITGNTDSFTGNAFGHSLGIHYEADTLGSRYRSQK